MTVDGSDFAYTEACGGGRLSVSGSQFAALLGKVKRGALDL
jgi:hypothetical protein